MLTSTDGKGRLPGNKLGVNECFYSNWTIVSITRILSTTAVLAGIEILRVKFGGNLTFPFCSHQIFSLMVMEIIPVLVALQVVLLS